MDNRSRPKSTPAQVRIPELRVQNPNRRNYVNEVDGPDATTIIRGKPSRKTAPLTSFLDAIQKGKKATIHIGGGYSQSAKCNCDGCVPPLEEFDDKSDGNVDRGFAKENNNKHHQTYSDDDETESEDDDVLFRTLPSNNIILASSRVVGDINYFARTEKISSVSVPSSSFKKLLTSSTRQRRSSNVHPKRRFDLVDTDDEDEEVSESDEDQDAGENNDYYGSVDDSEDEGFDSSFKDASFSFPPASPSRSISTNSHTMVTSLIRATETINLVDTDSDAVSISSDSLLSYDEESSFHSSSCSSVEIIATKPAPKTTKVITTAPSKRADQTRKVVQSNRESMAQSAFREFNREVFGGKLSSVEVIWSKKLNTTAGLTRLLKAQTSNFLNVPPARLAKVELSTKVIDDQAKLRTTLLHELIHAAVWILEGVSKPPHGKEFKRWAAHAMREIKDVKVTTTHSYEINYRYAWACTNSNCSFIVKRHSKSVDTKKHVCGRCKSSLIEVDPISSNGTSATPKTQPKPSAYNLFVKNQSKIVRQSLMQEQLSKGVKNPNVGQSDVMKECARRWRDHKQKQHTTSSS